MKSLLITGMLSMGVAHTGAFLEVWEVPHVENHLTIEDVGRKLNKVLNWEEQKNSLRDARAKAREENYALYEQPRGPQVEIKSTGRARIGGGRPMRSRSTSRK